MNKLDTEIDLYHLDLHNNYALQSPGSKSNGHAFVIEENNLESQFYQIKNYHTTQLSSERKNRQEFQNFLEKEEQLAEDEQKIEQLDELIDLLENYESHAYEIKTKINILDRGSQKMLQVPKSIQSCLSQIIKILKSSDDNQEVDIDDVQSNINTTIEQSIECFENFGKFKGDFFAVNEIIHGKDISEISLQTLNNQINQIEQLKYQVDEVEQNSQNTISLVEELQQKYQEFENSLFNQKFDSIEQSWQEVTQLLENQDSLQQNIDQILNDSKNVLKSINKINNSKQEKRIELQSKLNVSEQNLLKCQDQLLSISQLFKNDDVNEKKQKCYSIVQEQDYEGSFETMILRSKEFQKLIDFNQFLEKLKSQLMQTLSEAQELEGESQDLLKNLEDFQQDILGEESQEYFDIIQKNKDLSMFLMQGIQKQNSRLESYESHVRGISISGTYQMFLIKEIQRQKQILSQVEQQFNQQQNQSNLAEENLLKNSGDLNENDEKDIQKIKQNSKLLTKLMDVDMPRVTQTIDGLEQYMLKSLKQQLNDDNKRSQNQITKVKKSYEDFMKIYENLNKALQNCYSQILCINDQFEQNDFEREQMIAQIQEKLDEEKIKFKGDQNQSEKQVEQSMDLIDQNLSVQQTKRWISSNINKLVLLFNQICTVLREQQGSNMNDDVTLNDLIQKNKNIQSDCETMIKVIEENKKNVVVIVDRLNGIINDEISKEIVSIFREKDNFVNDCSKLKVKAEKQLDKLEQILKKQLDPLSDIISRLENVNQANYFNGESISGSEKQRFIDNIQRMSDTAMQHRESIIKFQQECTFYKESIQQAYQPVQEIKEREVSIKPELETVFETIQQIITDMSSSESEYLDKNAEVINLSKQVREILGQEVDKRSKEGQRLLETLDQEIVSINDLQNIAKKKLKYFKELIQKAQINQGKGDQFLQKKLSDQLLQLSLIDDDFSELDSKKENLKKEKSLIKKQIDEQILKSQKSQPAQMDSIIDGLEELDNKYQEIKEKINEIGEEIEERIQNLAEILKNCEQKQGIQGKLKTTEFELNEEFTSIKKILEKLKKSSSQIKSVVQYQRLNAENDNDDYFDQKLAIDEQLQELDELESVILKFQDCYDDYERERNDIISQQEQAQDINILMKFQQQIVEMKNNIGSLLTDSLETQDQVDELKNEIGDCQIPTMIYNRKKEIQTFSDRYERIQKELYNFKKLLKKPQFNNEALLNFSKSADFKLKALDREKQDLQKYMQKEIEVMQTGDDLNKILEGLKKLKKLKQDIIQATQKLKEVEDIENKMLKKLSEIDVELFSEFINAKTQGLLERSQKCQTNLTKINSDKLSESQEESMVSSLSNGIQNAIQNLEASKQLQKNIDKLSHEIKQKSDADKVSDLKQKINQVQESVYDVENSINQLEKKILDKSPQKKINKKNNELYDSTKK